MDDEEWAERASSDDDNKTTTGYWRASANAGNSVYPKGARMATAKVTETGDMVWRMPARLRGRKECIRVGGIFEWKGRACVGYVRLGAVAVGEEKGLRPESMDDSYLRWVLLAFSQLQDKQAERAESPAKEVNGRRDVFLVVVPRDETSVVRLYAGSPSTDMATNPNPKTGLTKNRNPRQFVHSVRYEEIDLKEPKAASLFRRFFLKHGLLADSG